MTDSYRDVEVDQDHMLEDFARIYDNFSEMMVTEPMANGLDIDSTEMKIRLYTDKDGMWIEFTNNGVPMSKKDMENYNVIARSTKSGKNTIGWAGIGAKLALGFDPKSKIITISGDGTKAIACEMILKGKKAKWKFIPTDSKVKGTTYRVLLNVKNYDIMKKGINDEIIKWFNTALLDGLKVTVDGTELKPWKPVIVKTFERTIKVNKLEIPVKIFITDTDIPNDRCWVQYDITGKRICIKKPENLIQNVREEFKKRFYVLVNAQVIADQLQTSKHGFKQGIFSNQLEPAIELELTRVLKQEGFLAEEIKSQRVKNSWSQALQSVLQDKFPDLLTAGRFGFGRGGTGKGDGEKTTTAQAVPEIKKTKDDEPKPRDSHNNGNLSFTTTIKPEDERQGWFHQAKGQIVINLGHPVAIPIITTKVGREYHLNRVVSTEVMRLAMRAGNYSVERMVEIPNIVFEAMLTARKTVKRKYKENFERKDLKRGKSGRFVKDDGEAQDG